MPLWQQQFPLQPNAESYPFDQPYSCSVPPVLR